MQLEPVELQYGYKDGDNKKSWYISGGPIATDTPFTNEIEYTFGGFLGGAYRFNDKTAVYGEIFGDTNETVSWKNWIYLYVLISVTKV